MTTSNITPQLPTTGFVRLWDIIGNKKAKPPIPALIPVSRSTFLKGIKTGLYPEPIKLGERSVAWRVQEIRNLIAELGLENSQA